MHGVDRHRLSCQARQHSHHSAGLEAFKNGYGCGGASANNVKENLRLELCCQRLVILQECRGVLQENMLDSILLSQFLSLDLTSHDANRLVTLSAG